MIEFKDFFTQVQCTTPRDLAVFISCTCLRNDFSSRRLGRQFSRRVFHPLHLHIRPGRHWIDICIYQRIVNFSIYILRNKSVVTVVSCYCSRQGRVTCWLISKLLVCVQVERLCIMRWLKLPWGYHACLFEAQWLLTSTCEALLKNPECFLAPWEEDGWNFGLFAFELLESQYEISNPGSLACFSFILEMVYAQSMDNLLLKE